MAELCIQRPGVVLSTGGGAKCCAPPTAMPPKQTAWGGVPGIMPDALYRRLRHDKTPPRQVDDPLQNSGF